MTAPTQTPGEGSRKFERGSEGGLSGVHGSVRREHPEPRASTEPIPPWLIAVFFGFVCWGWLYLAYNSGGFSADVFDPERAAAALRDAAAQAGPPDPKVTGRRVYALNCAVCHQANGLGRPGQFPPLAGSEWVLGQDWHGDNHLVRIVLNGLQGPIKVKGETFNNAMPTWSMLTDEQIAAVLTFIRSEWGNAAAPIPADYIKEIRSSTAGRTEPWKPKELQEIPAERAPTSPAQTPAPGK